MKKMGFLKKFSKRGGIMVKKAVSLMVLSVLLLSLAACGGGTESDVTKVRIWSSSKHSKDVMTKLADDWNNTTGKEKKIKIVYEIRENISSDVDMAMSAGNAPEMFGYLSAGHAMDGKIVALEDTEVGKQLLESYPEELCAGFKINGKTYSLPFSAATRGLVYNKDMFKAAGIVDENGEAKPPVTWAELVEDAKKLTNVSKDEYGIVFPMKWDTWVTSDMLSPGFSSVGFDGYNPVTGEYDYTGYEPIFNAVMQIKKDQSYLPGAEGLDNDPARAKFAEGKIGMKFAFSWDVGVFNDQFPAKCDWGVAEYAVIDADNKYKQLMSINGDMAINKTAADKIGIDKIMEVYKWYYSDEVITELYKNCMEIPVIPERVKDKELIKDKKGWVDFCNLVNISTVRPAGKPTDTSGQADLKSEFINKVWPGEMSAKTALENYTKIMNDGVKKYKEIHPEEDMEQYVNKYWNIKR